MGKKNIREKASGLHPQLKTGGGGVAMGKRTQKNINGYRGSIEKCKT